jgi:hypothetical protein
MKCRHLLAALALTMFAFDLLGGVVSPETYAGLPLSFERNVGQADSRVSFLSRGAGYGILLTGNGVMFSLHNRTMLRMSMVGANPNAEAAALEELPGRSSYFIGNDPGRWRTNVANFAKVQYKDVYPGIDLLFYGNHRQMEFDFVVAPGADPKAILLDLSAMSCRHSLPHIEPSGDLVMPIEGSEVRFHKPVAYQTNANGEKQLVAGNFVLRGKRRFGVAVDAYDRTRSLVIDPATYLGGTADDHINAMAVPGGVYVAGYTASNVFPGTTGRDSSRTDSDAFVVLLSADLKSVIHATYIGGSGSDSATAIAVSQDGVYVAGATSSFDFPGLLGGAQPFNAGGPSDGFVALLTPDLQTLTQSTCLGAIGRDVIHAIAVPTQRLAGGQYSVFVAGYTESRFFPKTAGGAQEIANAGIYDTDDNTTRGDGFAAVFSTDLKNLTQATYLGGSQPDHAYAIAVPPPGGAVYVAGSTDSGGSTNANGFPGVLNGAQPENGGGFEDSDGFVVYLTSDLTTLLNATYLGGNGIDLVLAMAVLTTDTGDNQIYVAGSTTSTNFPGTPSSTRYPGQGSAQGTFGGGCLDPTVVCGTADAFVTLLDSGLNHIQNSTYLGGSGSDYATALTVLGNHVYVVGKTNSGESGTTSFPHTQGGLQPTFIGGGSFGDAFLAQLGTQLKTFGQATYLGGPFDDEALAVAVRPDPLLAARTTVFVSGWTQTSSFFIPATTGGAQPAPSGSDDGFVAKLSLDQDWLFTTATATVPAMLNGSGNTTLLVSSVNSFASVVNFGVSAPAGFSTTLNPTTVTVSEGGSASTTLGITVGPSVTPGSYTLRLNSTSGGLTNSVLVSVIVSATTAGISNVIATLRNAGCIDNAGIANALTSKLSAAQGSLNRNDTSEAVSTLRALLNQLQAQAGKHISTSCTVNGVSFNPDSTLVTDVNALIENLAVFSPDR